MFREIKGIPFQYVCDIIPESDGDGMPKEYMPQSRYNNSSNIPLHEYGHGPFCRFKVPERHNRKTGVYIILVEGDPKYVGECEDLGMRFNMGYGNISPRNCYKGGQPTNCRVNTLILGTYKNGSRIELLFHETEDRYNIEGTLIEELHPEWNKTIGKTLRMGETQKVLNMNVLLYSEKRMLNMSKYDRFGQYLKNSQKQAERLSYNEIEGILGFKLPPSAYNHRPWWSGSRPHTNSWLNAGWQVSSVDLGKSITFRKIGKAQRTEEYRPIPQEIPPETKTMQRIEDIPKLIKELHHLKTEGIITEEEFEEKKKQLLSKL
jgi:hypothetical protein